MGTGVWITGEGWRLGELDGSLRDPTASVDATDGARLRSWRSLASHLSQLSATFIRSLPFASRPFDHSSAAAGPRLSASLSSCVISSTCVL
jgi:hypothetical protein